MPLVTSQGFQLTPQIGGSGLLQNVEALRQLQALGRQEEQAGRGEQIQAALAGIQQPTAQQQQLAEQSLVLGGEQPELQTRMSEKEIMAQASKIDPALARQHFKTMGIDSASKRAEASRFATQVLSLPVNLREQKILERAQLLQSQGRDPKDTIQLADMTEAEQDKVLQGVQMLDLATKERFVAQERIAARKVIIEKKIGKTEADKIKTDLKATKETFDRAAKLRGEISKISTDFNKQRGAWGRVQASAENPSPAGDLALIFNFMKVLDPGSTVREGEFAQVGAAGNLPTQAQRMFDSWKTGQKLTDGQRKDVVDRAKRLFNSADKTNKGDVNKLISIGKQFGVSKENLLGAEVAEPTPTGRTATNPKTGEKIQEMSDGSWRAV